MNWIVTSWRFSTNRDGTGWRVGGKLRKGRKGRIENSLVDHDYSLVPLRETWLLASASRWNFKARSEFSSLRFDLCTSCKPQIVTSTVHDAVALRVARIFHRESSREPVNLEGRLSNFRKSRIERNWILFPVGARASDREIDESLISGTLPCINNFLWISCFDFYCF